jgi:hypothetical protein
MTHATSIKPARTRLRTRLRGQRTLLCLGLLLAFFVVVFFLVPDSLPDKLPIFFQRLIGLANALLAMVTAMFAMREYGRSYNRLRIPAIGSVRSSVILGGLVFLAVFAWWLTPWAPIQPMPLEP